MMILDKVVHALDASGIDAHELDFEAISAARELELAAKPAAELAPKRPIDVVIEDEDAGPTTEAEVPEQSDKKLVRGDHDALAIAIHNFPEAARDVRRDARRSRSRRVARGRDWDPQRARGALRRDPIVLRDWEPLEGIRLGAARGGRSRSARSLAGRRSRAGSTTKCMACSSGSLAA